jgi:hypothetical protein
LFVGTLNGGVYSYPLSFKKDPLNPESQAALYSPKAVFIKPEKQGNQSTYNTPLCISILDQDGIFLEPGYSLKKKRSDETKLEHYIVIAFKKSISVFLHAPGLPVKLFKEVHYDSSWMGLFKSSSAVSPSHMMRHCIVVSLPHQGPAVMGISEDGRLVGYRLPSLERFVKEEDAVHFETIAELICLRDGRICVRDSLKSFVLLRGLSDDSRSFTCLIIVAFILSF